MAKQSFDLEVHGWTRKVNRHGEFSHISMKLLPCLEMLQPTRQSLGFRMLAPSSTVDVTAFDVDVVIS